MTSTGSFSAVMSSRAVSIMCLRSVALLCQPCGLETPHWLQMRSARCKCSQGRHSLRCFPNASHLDNSVEDFSCHAKTSRCKGAAGKEERCRERVPDNVEVRIKVVWVTLQHRISQLNGSVAAGYSCCTENQNDRCRSYRTSPETLFDQLPSQC